VRNLSVSNEVLTLTSVFKLTAQFRTTMISVYRHYTFFFFPKMRSHKIIFTFSVRRFIFFWRWKHYLSSEKCVTCQNETFFKSSTYFRNNSTADSMLKFECKETFVFTAFGMNLSLKRVTFMRQLSHYSDWCMGWTIRGSIPDRGKTLFFSP
jgi:hypothetical protein